MRGVISHQVIEAQSRPYSIRQVASSPPISNTSFAMREGLTAESTKAILLGSKSDMTVQSMVRTISFLDSPKVAAESSKACSDTSLATADSEDELGEEPWAQWSPKKEYDLF